MTELAHRTPVDTIAALVSSDNGRAQIEPVLPANTSFEKFVRIFRTAAMEDCARQANPDKWIVNADPASLLTALVKCATDGLVPDGRQAALVRRGDKVSYMPMVAGLAHIVGEYGWTVRGYAIHANDEFSYTVGDRPQHRPPHISEPRGDVIGSWAEATNRSGQRQYLVITPAELAKRRAMATTDNIWKAWTAQQAEKTARRDLCGELPLDPSDKARIERVFDVIDMTSGEAAAAFYGPPTAEASGVADPPEGGRAEGTGHGAPAAPVTSEPAVDADDEPAPAVTSSEEEFEQQAALAAADYTPPNGKFAATGDHGPKTIREILDLGEDGARWLKWALAQSNLGGDGHPEYAEAVWSFARIFAPALFQEALAKREVGA